LTVKKGGALAFADALVPGICGSDICRMDIWESR